MKQVNSSVENCILLNTARNGSDFVGIKITKEEREIIFPMGYIPSKEKIKFSKAKKITNQERKEILNLIKCIAYCTNYRQGERVSTINGKITMNFPIKAMLCVIEDFLDCGSYYTEKETHYSKNILGKINWLRTIRNIKPVITETGIAFLDFIIRKNIIQENQLITEIHKFCVYKSFELLGFLYTSVLPEKGVLQESDIIKNKNYFSQFLKEKIDSTCLECNIELFENLLEIINASDSEDETQEVCYGTFCFQIVWENMVEKIFSTISKHEKEKYFYPASCWTFVDGTKRKNVPLRPDTIMVLGRKCFIIDSKYYSYDSSREIDDEENEAESVLRHGSIPGTDSIQKQITYAQYIDCDMESFNSDERKHHRFSHSDIYNVFVLPADNGGEILKYIGNAKSDWNDGSKNYHTVHAVALDTRWVMENAGKSGENPRTKLSELIERI